MSDRDIEARIMRACIATLLGAGYVLSVDDGDGLLSPRSTDADYVFSIMRTGEEDFLHVARPGWANVGWVRFIYGNEGAVVINDHSVNLEAVLKPVNDLADRLDRGIEV